jgi:hypothetical protein
MSGKHCLFCRKCLRGKTSIYTWCSSCFAGNALSCLTGDAPSFHWRRPARPVDDALVGWYRNAINFPTLGTQIWRTKAYWSCGIGNRNFYINVDASEVGKKDGDGWADAKESTSCAHTNLPISGLCILGSVSYNVTIKLRLSLISCLVVHPDTNRMDKHMAVANRPRSVVVLASRTSPMKRWDVTKGACRASGSKGVANWAQSRASTTSIDILLL